MEPLTLRALERMLAVLVGGIAIYLGYRLFLSLPQQTDSSGKIILPGDISIYLSRVGPGVFFALFGAIVVGMSFYFQMKIDSPDEGHNLLSADPIKNKNISYIYLLSTEGMADLQALQSARARVRGDIRTLADLESVLGSPTEGNYVLVPRTKASDFLLTVHRSKMAMIFTVWDKDWGEFPQFAKWVKKGPHDKPPEEIKVAADIFKGK